MVLSQTTVGSIFLVRVRCSVRCSHSLAFQMPKDRHALDRVPQRLIPSGVIINLSEFVPRHQAWRIILPDYRKEKAQNLSKMNWSSLPWNPARLSQVITNWIRIVLLVFEDDLRAAIFSDSLLRITFSLKRRFFQETVQGHNPMLDSVLQRVMHHSKERFLLQADRAANDPLIPLRQHVPSVRIKLFSIAQTDSKKYEWKLALFLPGVQKRTLALE